VQVEQITIALRARNGWEAIDLGIRMAAHWARPLWSAWLCVFVPTAGALIVVFHEFPLLAWLILWWLKPVFDRFALHVLSRAVFGRAPSLSETLAAWREILSPGLLIGLITRLYDFRRSFHLPIQQLERQHGAAARERAKLLGSRAGGFASALTLVFIQFEWVISIGIFGLIALFAPDVQLQPDSTFDDADLFSLNAFAQLWAVEDVVIYALVVCLLEPFYVASGFALYLNRRVLLEGWDVELGMRRLAMRQHGTLNAHILSGIGGLLVCGMLLMATPTPIFAASAEDGSHTLRAEAVDRPVAKRAPGRESTLDQLPGDKDVPDVEPDAENDIDYPSLDTPAFRAARKVISDPVFGSERQVERWKSRKSSAPQRFNLQSQSGGFLSSLFAAIAELLRVGAWLAIAVLVVWLIRLLLKFSYEREPREPALTPPTTLFGLAIAPESLPDDVADAARRALAQGFPREALSLLYRGALSYLLHERGLRISRGATEGDVLALAIGVVDSTQAQLFEDLLPQWMEVAYAGRLPATASLAALIETYAHALEDPIAGKAKLAAQGSI